MLATDASPASCRHTQHTDLMTSDTGITCLSINLCDVTTATNMHTHTAANCSTPTTHIFILKHSQLPWFPFYNLDQNLNCMLQICCSTQLQTEKFHNSRHTSRIFGAGSPGLDVSAIVLAHARPKTTRSNNELAPSRLAPWTETQADSPAPYRPRTTLSCPFLCSITCQSHRDHTHTLSHWHHDRTAWAVAM